MTEKERRLAFEALVLSGIWNIILLLKIGFKLSILGSDFPLTWRMNVLAYLDFHGVQGEEAKRVRRERSFPNP